MNKNKTRQLFLCRKKLTMTNLLALIGTGAFLLCLTGNLGLSGFSFFRDSGIIGTQTPIIFPSNTLMTTSNCEQPHLPIYNPEIMKHIREVKRITCSDAEKDWVVNNGSHAFITEDAKKKFGKIICKFIELERDGDFWTKQSGKITIGEYFKFETSDFVRCQCSASSGNITWETFFASPRANVNPKSPSTDSDSDDVAKNPKNRLSVLLWGHDSLSRNMFERTLPKTYHFVKNTLGGIVVEGYNIVGDGTPQALIPILTGSTELELPETRKSQARAQPVDVYPFIFNKYKEKGYLTGYMEDKPGIGTFQFRLKGFVEAPAEYYMRPFFIAVESHISKYKSYCIGSIPTHKIVMNYVNNIFLQKPEIPKFVFSFHSELSHGDASLIQGADEDLQELMTDLTSSNILNQTILILMSDHGPRFAKFRETLQGKQEERKPIIMFVFPPWFKGVYPKAYENFQMNTNRLSTPFDLHKTLLDIQNLPDLPESYFSQMNDLKSRGMSLFKQIPSSRSCSDADIEPHWCACLQWNIISTNDTLIQRTAKEFVNFLNGLTSSHRDLCEALQLSQVLWAANSFPKDELLQFKKSVDSDGRFPDMSDNTVVANTIIQIKVETLPGNGHYEASVLYHFKSLIFEFKESDISRIDKYGTQASCVRNNKNLEYLSKYCFCRQNETHQNS